MSGAVESLLAAMQRLSEDTDSADVVFVLAGGEERVYAHRILLAVRLTSFQPLPPASAASALTSPSTTTSAAAAATNNKRNQQSAGNAEFCRIPGSVVAPPTALGAPTTVRLPAHVQPDVFRQFMHYVYTGKVSVGFRSRVVLLEIVNLMSPYSLDYAARLTRLRDDDARPGPGTG